MNSTTFKIRIFNDNLKEDNIVLSIHCPLEVFYLSVIKSALADLDVEYRKTYFVTESDYYDGDEYVPCERVLCTLEEIFDAKDFKDFCYRSYMYSSKPLDAEFASILLLREKLLANLEADLDDEDVAFVRENPVVLDDDQEEELYTAVENFVQGGDIDG